MVPSPILQAVDLELTPEYLAEIDREASKVEVQGEHLPEAGLKMSGHRNGRLI